ncbi:TonB-dependent receptor [Niveispirillum sp. KHB5.9]|uniref:TonB-dependent receptor n=1 Tax=Niveispirillum sp. KHB5.9 TaxID=3400269 RepID=UPI003A8919D3
MVADWNSRFGRMREALLIAVGSTALMTVPATAQTAGKGQADSQDVIELEEIVVTARKRNESVLDVPIAISVFSADKLEKANVKGLQDLQNTVPGLYYQERGNLQTYVSIRGVGGDARNIGLESGVTIAVDGVSSGRSNAYNMDLAQIAQVEVLRGPQGTLFGTNTIGGVINITTKRPSDDVAVSADVSYANFETVRTTVAASGPLSDTLFVGGTVSSWNSRGYIYNSMTGSWVQGQNRIGGRLQAQWVPTDRLEIYVTADKTRDRRAEVLTQIVAPYVGYAATNVPRDRYTITATSPNKDDRDMTGVNATVDYALDEGFAIKSISSYRVVKTDVASDGDVSPQLLSASGPYTDDAKFFTQELRLVSPADWKLRFVGGVYAANTDGSSFRFLNSGTFTTTLDAGIKTETYAAYLNGDFDVTSFLTLNAGVRQNSEKKDGHFRQVRSNSAALTYNFPDLDRKDDGTSWTGSVKLKLSPQASAYATVSRGFKSGGFNTDTLGSAGLSASSLSFAPESVTNYEAGLKTMLFDRKLGLNVALFQLDYSNRQVLQFNDAGPGTLPFITIRNAASSRTRGIEIDGSLVLPAGWSVAGSFSYLDAKYRDFENATAAGASYTGNYTEQTPRYTGSVAIDNVTPVGDGRALLHADASYNGVTYFDAANNPLNVQEGYWLFNGRVGYERELSSGQNTIGIFAFGRNITNKDYFLLKRQAFAGNQGQYGAPRTYGLQLTYKY